METLVYSFILEGENVDGDLLSECVEFENVESFKEACELAEKEAENLLKFENGGHIDIFDIDGVFLSDVEV
jgi:hypothetical protein